MTSYTYDAKGRRIATITAEPSFEIAEMLYNKGFRAETLDAYWPLAQREPEWFDWSIASWNPSPECMTNFETLVVKYGVSLNPLTQAQKDRMLHLAKWLEMNELAEALQAAGAKIQ